MAKLDIDSVSVGPVNKKDFIVKVFVKVGCSHV